MIAAIIPPPIAMPSCGNNQPAMRPPIIPTMMSANQPVTAAFDHHAGEPTGDATDDQLPDVRFGSKADIEVS